MSYGPLEMPQVEVELDGVWRPGVVQMQITRSDGSVLYQVQYRVGKRTSLDTFPAERVRDDILGGL